MGSRTVFAVVGWLAAAAAATVVGLGAVRVIGEGITGTAATTLTQEEVAEALASAPPSPSPEPTASPSPRPTPTRTQVPRTTLRPAGSTITAHCDGDLVTIDRVAPPQGYQTTDYDRGATGEAEVRFDSGGKGRGSGRVEVQVTCEDGRPRATVDD
jgi:serine/threonine-protein kinase